MSPFILATAPRDARSQCVNPTAGHKLSPSVDDREGVLISPFGGESKDEKDERLPGAGKGGMAQLASAGNVSMFF